MHFRRIKSYVLRQGRMTDAQAMALEKYWPIYGIDCNNRLLDLEQIYSRRAPKILDIGSGMGDSIIELASKHIANDYLAIEVHRPGVGNLIKMAVNQNTNNIRAICHDAVEVLQHQLPQKCLDEVYIFFPDPWPKKRHHKRRLVSPEFMGLLLPKLKLNARLFLATDWQELAEHMLSVCDDHPGLANLAGQGNYSPRPAWRPLTKYEKRGIRLEHPVWDLCYSLSKETGVGGRSN